MVVGKESSTRAPNKTQEFIWVEVSTRLSMCSSLSPFSSFLTHTRRENSSYFSVFPQEFLVPSSRLSLTTPRGRQAQGQ